MNEKELYYFNGGYQLGIEHCIRSIQEFIPAKKDSLISETAEFIIKMLSELKEHDKSLVA